jgi:hypothetical protein
VKWLRDQGAERVVILGNSGGGSLMGAYQAEATAPTLDAGMQGAAREALSSLPKTDLYVSLNAHAGPARGADQLARSFGHRRARSGRDRPGAQSVQQGERPALFRRVHHALPGGAARAQPAHHRLVQGGAEAAQRGRHSGPAVRAVPRLGRPALHGRAIDPSDRVTPGCYRGDPAVANRGFGLGRANTLRSWLSMWSLETSKCQGPEQLAKFAIPALVIQSRADQGVSS